MQRAVRSGAASADDVVDFWSWAGPGRWFTKDAAFDAMFRDAFLDRHFDAACGRLHSWLATARGTLAVLILLDQFPRNSFRGSPRMFWTDRLARLVADRGIRHGLDVQVEDHGLRNFCYLPFVHSERLEDQERAVALTSTLSTDAGWHARVHRDIIRRFGRFPHRNAVLGRSTTAQEQAFLDAGGFAG
ncbi:MAG TPA: DUF924 family protein [Ramlibacter sp.]|nr:DUF924 family protein [Ramlibacter sp.]